MHAYLTSLAAGQRLNIHLLDGTAFHDVEFRVKNTEIMTIQSDSQTKVIPFAAVAFLDVL